LDEEDGPENFLNDLFGGTANTSEFEEEANRPAEGSAFDRRGSTMERSSPAFDVSIAASERSTPAFERPNSVNEWYSTGIDNDREEMYFSSATNFVPDTIATEAISVASATAIDADHTSAQLLRSSSIKFLHEECIPSSSAPLNFAAQVEQSQPSASLKRKVSFKDLDDEEQEEEPERMVR
jgi:hypothetical protein